MNTHPVCISADFDGRIVLVQSRKLYVVLQIRQESSLSCHVVFDQIRLVISGQQSVSVSRELFLFTSFRESSQTTVFTLAWPAAQGLLQLLAWVSLWCEVLHGLHENDQIVSFKTYFVFWDMFRKALFSGTNRVNGPSVLRKSCKAEVLAWCLNSRKYRRFAVSYRFCTGATGTPDTGTGANKLTRCSPWF